MKFTAGKYLKATDLPRSSDMVVTITGHGQAVMQDGEEKFVLSFKETNKQLVLNIGNGKVLTTLFGSDEMSAWHDKKIALHVQDVLVRGELTPAIRVRSELPAAPQPVEVNEMLTTIDLAGSTPELWKLMTAINAAPNLIADERAQLAKAVFAKIDALKAAA